MSILFSVSEVLRIALGIEENGAAFYQALANKTQNKDARIIYDHLAGEERKHLNTFQGMLNSVGQYQPPEAYTEEHLLYLKSLVDNSVFSNITEVKQIATKISSETEAIETGIQAEKDSILFYTEMQTFVRKADHQLVCNIIDEEKSHLKQLTQLKQTL